MDAVRAQAPVRIDLAGGTIDVWPLPYALKAPVVTVNVALDLPCRVHVARRADGRWRLRSVDLQEEVTHPSLAALEASLEGPRPPLALLARAVAASRPGAAGLDVTVEATSPAGAGLGGSSGLLVALLGALDHLEERARSPEDLIRLAQEIETTLMRGPTGYQDFYPPFFGGCLALEGGIGGPHVERLPVDLAALAARLRLVYTGAPHVSAVTNGEVLAGWLRGESEAVSGLEGIRDLAAEVRRGLRAGDLDATLAAVIEEGALRRRLAPGVDSETTRAVDEAVRQAGALGTKILGAGGGGCVLVVLPPTPPAGFDAALAAAPGRVLPLHFVAGGLALSEV